MSADRVRVFYDGDCYLCSSEMDHYRRRDKDGRLDLCDIADPHFDAAAFGLTQEAVQREMHAQLPDGRIVRGVDAFIAIWDVLPGYGVLSRIVGGTLRPLFHLGYQVFARVRPYLPRRKARCADGACAVASKTRRSVAVP